MPLLTDAGTLKLITVVGVMKDGRLLLVDYRNPPVPRKQGWWVPQHEFDYGEHPARRVEAVLAELGLHTAPYRLVEIESEVRATGWHLIMHYWVDADEEPRPGPDLGTAAWFGPDGLPAADAFALGEAHLRLAERFLCGHPPRTAPRRVRSRVA